jgi:hypothetical protein
MAEPTFLPGQKAECSRCGTEVTLWPNGDWTHTAPGKKQIHEIKHIEYDEANLIKPEDSLAFIQKQEKLKQMRTIPGQPRVKKEKPAPPAEEPKSPSPYGVRTTANCKVCHKGIKVINHPETGERVWVHNEGPQHAETIVESKSTLKAAAKTDEEKALLKGGKVGKPSGDAATGLITVPGKPGKYKWDPDKGEVTQVEPGRETEVLQGDPDYISATGELTSKREAAISKEDRADRGIRLKGEKHLDEEHPWSDESSIVPPEQRQIPVRASDWKKNPNNTRASVDVMLGKVRNFWTDIAHWHKEKFDTKDQYEYRVYAEQPEIGEPRAGIERRLKYCPKCSPVVLEDGSLPNGTTDPSARRLPNPKQKFTRGEVQELPQGTKPWARTLPSGRITVGRQPNAKSTPVIRGLETRLKGFFTGQGEGK